MGDRTVLVLGGGIGGVATASLLKEKLGDRVRVKLVERKKHFQFPPSFPWLMLGLRTAAAVQRDMNTLKAKGIEVVHGEVTSIDTSRKSVRTTKGDLAYDDLVVALGAEYAPETVPGFAEHAHHVYDLDSALRFKQAIEAFPGGTIAVGVSTAGGVPPAFGRLDRAPSLRARLGLCAARRPAGSQRPPHRHRPGRHPPPARPPAAAEGGHPAGRPARHAGHPAA